MISLARSPRLETVKMVEEFIQKHDGEFKRKQLWETLPKKMMYQTFKVILEYLLESGKIALDRRGIISWVCYPERITYWKQQTHLHFGKKNIGEPTGH